MQIMEHVRQVTFDDFPKMLVELNRKAIRAWCFVVFHAKNFFLDLLFSERSREKLVFWLTDLRDIIPPIIQAEVVVLRWSKQVFIELGDILFEVLLTLYFPPSCSREKMRFFRCLPLAIIWKYLVLLSPRRTSVALAR